MVAPRFGLYTQGVLQSGDTVDVRVLLGQRRLDGLPADRAREQRAGDRVRDGDADHRLRAAARCSSTVDGDRRGRRRAHVRWDFDGDGDTDSTAEDPTHTYTTAGTYEAEVTVSDGEDERTAHGHRHGASGRTTRRRASGCSCSPRRRASGTTRSTRASPRSRSSARTNDFQVDATEDATRVPRRRRSRTTTRWSSCRPRVTRSTTTQQAAFERYIRGGRRLHRHPRRGRHRVRRGPGTASWWARYFRNHPAGTPTATVHVEDTDHHSTTGPAEPAGTRVDEWYNYQSPDGAVVGGGGTRLQPARGRRARARHGRRGDLRRGGRQHDG